MRAAGAGARRIARVVRIRGVVQGVGFRPHVMRLAHQHAITGWVRNGDQGVQIHAEGSRSDVEAFIRSLEVHPPPAARIERVEAEAAPVTGTPAFEIRASTPRHQPTTRISADLPVCDDCLRELRDVRDRRSGYPYINCTNCGPRYSIVQALPYDRARTTMAAWPLCAQCRREYEDEGNRRFHAQPVACPACGPQVVLIERHQETARGRGALDGVVHLLRGGQLVAIKGIGGYHLCCDAERRDAVQALRERKVRKEQAFAVMVRDERTADETVHLSRTARQLLVSMARPIVLAPARITLPGVAPDNADLGIMLPYAPLHHLLFDAGAPPRLVVTSGNRSNEPIAYVDTDAMTRLDGLADAVLLGERAIARRVDDSVVRVGPLGPTVIRRARGLAPAAVARIASDHPILAVGADLKNAVTLVVDGQAYVSQHIGDLSLVDTQLAFDETIRDWCDMYAVDVGTLVVVHDAHPEYVSTSRAAQMPAAATVAVQHHRAHVASVVAEQGAFDRRVVGVAFDGTGYGDDGAIWGGELFVGSVAEGFVRTAHLRTTALVGGDAAARHPVQAAAGFLGDLDLPIDFAAPPFGFPDRYQQALAVRRSQVRVARTSSAGRLFDTVAALTGFTRPVTFEGQAAMWLEQLARGADDSDLELPCGVRGSDIDWREMLAAVCQARLRGTAPACIARAVHRALGRAVADAVRQCARHAGADTVALSGGVMQNQVLVRDVLHGLERGAAAGAGLTVWMNREVPANDGGISLGQAAMAAYGPR